MEEEVRAAVFGNVGTMIVFRVGAYDAEILEKEFAPTFTAEDIVNLGFTQIYLKLMIDGISSPPFSATSLPPIPQPDTSLVSEVIASSREQFAHTRASVESAIVEWHKPIAKAPPVPPAAGASQASTSALAATAAPKAAAPASAGGGRSAPAPFTPKPAQVAASVPKAAVTRAPVAPSAPASTSVSTPTSVPSSKPAPISAPTPVKPFKTAFENLDEERVSIPVKKSQPMPSSPPPTPSGGVSAVSKPTPSPVSLSTLAPKPQPVIQNTQKIPTAKNVADLKNALASILNKTSGENKPTSEKVSGPTSSTDVTKAHAVPSSEGAEKNTPPVQNPTPTSAQALKPMPKEVPKDVLEKLLKLD